MRFLLVKSPISEVLGERLFYADQAVLRLFIKKIFSFFLLVVGVLEHLLKISKWIHIGFTTFLGYDLDRLFESLKVMQVFHVTVTLQSLLLNANSIRTICFHLLNNDALYCILYARAWGVLEQLASFGVLYYILLGNRICCFWVGLAAFFRDFKLWIQKRKLFYSLAALIFHHQNSLSAELTNEAEKDFSRELHYHNVGLCYDLEWRLNAQQKGFVTENERLLGAASFNENFIPNFVADFKLLDSWLDRWGFWTKVIGWCLCFSIQCNFTLNDIREVIHAGLIDDHLRWHGSELWHVVHFLSLARLN